jgi:hypothetical protein
MIAGHREHYCSGMQSRERQTNCISLITNISAQPSPLRRLVSEQRLCASAHSSWPQRRSELQGYSVRSFHCPMLHVRRVLRALVRQFQHGASDARILHLAHARFGNRQLHCTSHGHLHYCTSTTRISTSHWTGIYRHCHRVIYTALSSTSPRSATIQALLPGLVLPLAS